MSKNRIRWIVALMAVGLLGLIGLQLYWIGSELRLQKEQFAYKVTDALQEVVRALERQDIVYVIKQRTQAREQQNRLMAIAKKENKGLLPGRTLPRRSEQLAVAGKSTDVVPTTKGHRNTGLSGMPPAGSIVVQSDILHPIVQPLSPEQMVVVEEFFRQQDELMAVGDWQNQLAQQQHFDQWVEHVLTDELNRINKEVADNGRLRDSAGRATRNRIHRFVQPRTTKSINSANRAPVDRPASLSQHRAEEQSHIIKDVLKGLLLSDRPIEDRVNRLALDTLLRQALIERGIAIPFAYGVRTRMQPQFLFTSLDIKPKQFDMDGYKAALFPNNLIETGNYVYVYFPTQQQFILSRLGFMTGASVVLILIILACFYAAISTIVQQKKLADIKNDFINNMTHEFKTPISTISLAVEMAQEQLQASDVALTNARNSAGLVWAGTTSHDGPDDQLPDQAAPDRRLLRYMGIIRDETRRLGSHVEKVLQMALLDRATPGRGDIKLNLSPVNVHDVIENVLNNIGLQIEQREGEVELEFDADTEIVEADEVHLTNIVYNLVDNAVKYSPEPPHITIRTRSLPEGISLTVADQGLGMTNEQMSRIFEMFYRVPTGNRHDVKGFGLGLSYVKKMIDEHHGQIRVESQLGKGSSFEIILPYKMNNE